MLVLFNGRSKRRQPGNRNDQEARRKAGEASMMGEN